MSPNDFDFNTFKSTGEAFFERLLKNLLNVGIPANQLQSDHLCYRVGSLAEYASYTQSLAHHGLLLTEALVNGRPISTFRLHEPFKTSTFAIPLVEIPSPKAGTDYPTGFEHAEFVINESFAEFRAKYPRLIFTENASNTINSELCLRLTPHAQAKFHRLPLDTIIELEAAAPKP